jgi:hypothetical protein
MKRAVNPWSHVRCAFFADRNRSKIRIALTFDVLKNPSLFKYKEYSVLCIKTFSKMTLIGLKNRSLFFSKITLIGLRNRSYFIMKNVRFLCIGNVSKKILIFYCEKFSKTIPFIIFVCGPEHFFANLIKSV